MKTSERGIAFLERHEGTVLKAYRCPAGVWTIGAGLTKASGVVTPFAGMRVTNEEASRLLQATLNRNYEPAVAKSFPVAKQHEFDAAVSFHFNTGAIARASWVGHWMSGAKQKARNAFTAWNKGGGRVLPGLARRRDEEWQLLAYGAYSGKPPSTRSGMARVAVPLTREEMIRIRDGLRGLGFDPGVDVAGVTAMALVQFQRAHDLTPDGVLGRATLSTLQRMLDARAKAAAPTAIAGAGGSAIAAPDLSDTLSAIPGIEWVGVALVTFAMGLAAWRVFHYRDAVAAKIAPKFPLTAAKLRSF